MHSPLRLRPAAVMVKLALACLAAGHAHAGEPVVEPANVLSLDDVVVTASGFEQNLEDAPASMTVITGDELRKKSFRDLTDALRDVEGGDRQWRGQRNRYFHSRHACRLHADSG